MKQFVFLARCAFVSVIFIVYALNASPQRNARTITFVNNSTTRILAQLAPVTMYINNESCQSAQNNCTTTPTIYTKSRTFTLHPATTRTIVLDQQELGTKDIDEGIMDLSTVNQCTLHAAPPLAMTPITTINVLENTLCTITQNDNTLRVDTHNN